MGNMREISIEECMKVSGGLIVVTGSRKTTPVYEQFYDSGSFTYRSFDGFGSSNIFGGFGRGGGYAHLASLLSDFFDVEDGPVDEGDDDRDGILNRDEEIVVIGAKSDPGSWYGGGWVAGLTGASVSGGGDQRYADWLLGLGGGYNIGYSADSDIAVAYADISPDRVIAPNVTMINGVPFIFQIPAVSNIEFDPYTGTYGIGFGAGGAYAIKTIERNGSKQ